MKHEVDSSGGLKHAFGAHQQTHGAETSAPGDLAVTLREWKVWGGQAEDENRGTYRPFSK